MNEYVLFIIGKQANGYRPNYLSFKNYCFSNNLIIPENADLKREYYELIKPLVDTILQNNKE